MASRLKHDQIFRKALENPLVAHEFFDAHLPKHIKDILDLNSLKIQKESFVEPNLKTAISDVLFSARFNDQDGYIYLLLEHQSTPNHFMAFRLFKYMLNICDRYITSNPKSKTLPLIYPLIFFNGQKQYNAPRSLWDLFANDKLAREIWINNYKLVNVNEIPDSEFKTRVWSGILEFFLKHINERELLKRWQEISDVLPELAKVSIGYNYIEMILCYTLTKIRPDDKLELERMLKSKLNEEIGTKLMRSLADHWEQQGIQLGKAEGIQIGEARGIEIGKARGKVEAMRTVVKTMLEKNKSISEIMELTGLSQEDIKNLREA